MRGHILSAISALIGLGALASCGAGQSAANDAPAEAPVVAEPDVEKTGTIIEVRMLTRDPEDPVGLQVFKPRLVTARVGDTIRFVPTDPAHNVTSIDGMMPEGADGFDGALNEEITYVVAKPGVYGFKCLPHYAAGMVGLIVVEGGDNAETAKRVNHPGLAGREFAELFDEAGL
ncbi:MAG: pseudoazurin [Pseudomonadota bacterium]